MAAKELVFPLLPHSFHLPPLPSGLSSFPTAVLYPILAAFLIVLVVGRLVSSFRLRQSAQASLSHIPGPPLAAWTRLWIAWALGTGRSHEIWNEVNTKYGPIARIGPNHLLTSDPEITRRILAARSGYLRGPWFDSIRIDPHVANIVSERDAKVHAKLRAKLAPSFTGTSVAAMEPVIDSVLLDWLATLRKRFRNNNSTAGGSNRGHFVDIGQKIQFLTVDIITKICLGDALGCVAQDRDVHRLLETVETGNRVCQYFSVFLGLNTLLSRLARVPMLKRALIPKAGDSSGVGRLLGVIHEVVEKRFKEGHQQDDVVSSLLARGMSREHIDSELIIALVAGSDTTSTSVQATLLAIITNPDVYAKLRAEIRAFVSSSSSTSSTTSSSISSAPSPFSPGSTPKIIQDHEAKHHLPYLQACVLEGLRKHPPLTQLRERVVPAGGDTLSLPSGGDTFHVPAGTFIGLNAWGTQMDRGVYGEDAEVFRPERWLEENDQQRLHAMHQTHSLIFGHGSTKCLGQAMAVMEITKVIFELLRNFDISIANPYKPWSSECCGIFYQKNFLVRLRDVGEENNVSKVTGSL